MTEQEVRQKMYEDEVGSKWAAYGRSDLPSPEEIDQRRDEIKAGWDARERASRIADDRFKLKPVTVMTGGNNNGRRVNRMEIYD